MSFKVTKDDRGHTVYLHSVVWQREKGFITKKSFIVAETWLRSPCCVEGIQAIDMLDFLLDKLEAKHPNICFCTEEGDD